MDPCAFCKVLKDGRKVTIKQSDIYVMQSGSTLSSFDSVPYKKSNSYVFIEENWLLVICVLEVANTEAELESKIFDKAGKLKRIPGSKRLSTGPVMYDLDPFKLDLQAAKNQRFLDKAKVKDVTKKESSKIIKTDAKHKNKKSHKKTTEIDIGAATKAAEEADAKILVKASKLNQKPALKMDPESSENKKNENAGPDPLNSNMKQSNGKLRLSSASEESEESDEINSDLDSSKKVLSTALGNKSPGKHSGPVSPIKLQSRESLKKSPVNEFLGPVSPIKLQTAESSTKSPVKASSSSSKNLRCSTPVERHDNEQFPGPFSPSKLQSAGATSFKASLNLTPPTKRSSDQIIKHGTVKKRILQENNSEHIVDDQTAEAKENDQNIFATCGNSICQSQLLMAARTVTLLTDRVSNVSDALKAVKCELKEIKGLLNGAKSKTPKGSSAKCNLQRLTDVNPDPRKEYTVPEGMVHVGAGRFVSLVAIAKLEKDHNLRSRMKGLCELYWPGEELKEWSLDGKKGHKITSDFSCGMAEILRAMVWRKKANLSDENIHRTLSRALSELNKEQQPTAPKNEGNAEKKKENVKKMKKKEEASDTSDESSNGSGSEDDGKDEDGN